MKNLSRQYLENETRQTDIQREIERERERERERGGRESHRMAIGGE